MPRRAPYYLRWSPAGAAYEFSSGEHSDTPTMMVDDASWFACLEGISSFSFQSRTGAHCTMRKETVQGRGAYWYAYRSLQRRTKKRYLGRTTELTFAHLEMVTESLGESAHSEHTSVDKVDISRAF